MIKSHYLVSPSCNPRENTHPQVNSENDDSPPPPKRKAGTYSISRYPHYSLWPVLSYQPLLFLFSNSDASWNPTIIYQQPFSVLLSRGLSLLADGARASTVCNYYQQSHNTNTEHLKHLKINFYLIQKWILFNWILFDTSRFDRFRAER